MTCTACGRVNPDDARFCFECGQPLRLVCRECGALLLPDARFCAACGTRVSLEPTAPASNAAVATLPAKPAQPSAFANGRYVVKRFLGEGGKKQVYLAHDELLDRDIAFALIKTAGLDEVGVERIRREARTMGRLGGHPYIVSVYDMGEEDGRPYLVSELMGGGDVEGMIEKAAEHRPPLADALRIADQVCQALAYAHEHGIIHRDLKPGNVWLTSDGTAKLGDFGLAISLAHTRLSIAGMIVGTVGYMPPEQALGRPPDARSDLYSLGAMLYEMVAGRPPFLGDDPVTIISQHVNTPPVAPSWHNPQTPPQLESLILRLLEKDPEARPASAAVVRAELAALAEVAPATTNESGAAQAHANPLDRLAGGVFVGRERELESLRAAFDAALSGRSSVVLLTGEPGIGKTRLAEELATYASMRGAQALWGRSYEWEGAPAYWSWIQAIRDYVHARDPQALRSELGSGAGEIARIVSEVRERLPGLPEPAQLDGEHARFRLFDSVATFIKNATTHQPLVLVFDDLHWADKSSLQLLQFVVRELRAARLLVIGTYRDTEVGRGHPLSVALADLAREPRTQRLALRGLKRADVARYLALTTGITPSERLVDAVYAETEGNGFFVTEVTRLLTAEGRLEHDGAWSETLPQGVRDVVGRRLDRLSADTNEVLTVAAVIGHDFSVALLERVTERPVDQLLDLLEEAVQARVIREDGVARYRFSQELIQETLYNELSTGRRLRLHATIARQIERLYSADLARYFAGLAHHYSEAAPTGTADKAVEYAVKAAEHAEVRFAWETAIDLYQRALRVLDGVQPPDEARVCELLLAMGADHWHRGDMETGQATYFAAAQHARNLRAPELLARAALGYAGADLVGWGFQGEHKAGLLLEALDLLPRGDSMLRAQLLGKLANTAEVLPRDGLVAQSHALSADGVAIARRIGDPRTLMFALSERAWALGGPDHIEDIGEIGQEIAHLADVLGDRQASLIGVHWEAFPHWCYGKLDEYVAVWQRVGAATKESLDSFWQGGIFIADAMRARVQGNYQLVEQSIQKLQTYFGATGIGEQYRLMLLFPIRREQGRLAELRIAIEAYETSDVIEMLIWHCWRATVHWELGEPESARAIFDQLAAREFADVPRDILWLTTIPLMGEMAALLGDAAQAATLYELLVPHAGHNVGHFGFGLCLGSVSYYLGLLATLLERDADAARHFEEALAFNERMGARPFVAQTQYDAYAEMLVKRGAPDDQQRALELTDAALSAAEQIGMTRLAEQALGLKVRVQGILKA